METLRTLLAALGAPGAVRNAEAALLARQAEDLAIARLTHRLALVDQGMGTQPAA